MPQQVGWFVAVSAVLGLLRMSSTAARRRMWPFLAMLLATYATFAPLAEVHFRHSIYWVPAIVVLAIEGVTVGVGFVWRHAGSRVVSGSRTRAACATILALAIVTGASTVAKERPAIRGYEEAAAFVLEHSGESKFCLFDGWWDGNFTYQLRHLDPHRRLSVLRGDKLFYGFICVPDTDYTEYAANDREMLDLIDRQSPKYIVVEEPQIMTHIPAAERLRTLLREHPDQFALAKSIPVRGGKLVRDYELRIYHNLAVHSAEKRPVEFEVLGLGKSVRSASVRQPFQADPNVSHGLNSHPSQPGKADPNASHGINSHPSQPGKADLRTRTQP